MLAIDVITGTVSGGTMYIGLAATIAGVSIPVAGQVVMGVVGIACSAWGIGRLVASVYDATSE